MGSTACVDLFPTVCFLEEPVPWRCAFELPAGRRPNAYTAAPRAFSTQSRPRPSQVPELTRSAGIQLNKRLSLRRQFEMLSQPRRVDAPERPVSPAKPSGDPTRLAALFIKGNASAISNDLFKYPARIEASATKAAHLAKRPCRSISRAAAVTQDGSKTRKNSE
jgi:hypothetical protein